MKKKAVLYISYDGMLEPLGQSQVLGYLAKLAVKYPIYLLSFEKRKDWLDQGARERLQREIKAAGIHWYPLRYHKRPASLATAYDVMRGIIMALIIVLRHRIAVVHARSYVAGVVALFLRKLCGCRFVFDMRGFWADERADAGFWDRAGPMYKTAKWFERRFLLAADCVISLTHAGVSEMVKFPYLQGRMPRFEVIPTCVDQEKFCPGAGPEGTPDDRQKSFTLGWVGAVRGWYLFDEALLCFRILQDMVGGAARLRILNRGEHDYIAARLAAHGLAGESVEVKAVSLQEVPAEMIRMDAGIFFIMPVFSKKASAPTKLGEFLACGVPCLGNDGIGDMTGVLAGEKVGVVIDKFDDFNREQAVRALLDIKDDPGIRKRCVAAAAKHFSLQNGVAAYDRIYRELMGAA